MIFHNIINMLFGNSAQADLFRILFSHEEGMTGRGLAGLVGVSHSKVQHLLKPLIANGIVTVSSIGKAHRYRLQRSHHLVKKILQPLMYMERSLLLDIGTRIAETMTPTPMSVLVYGSVARGDEQPTSDLDLLVITDGETPSRIKEKEGGDIREEIARTHGNHLSLLCLTKKEVQKRVTEKDSLVRNILREGKVIHGCTIAEVLA